MVLKESWSTISKQESETYLHYYPTGLKIAMGQFITKQFNNPTILDLGCGNAHLYSVWKSAKFKFDYTGVDWSSPLLDSAKVAVGSGGIIVDAEINEHLENCGHFDCVVLCHVMEIMESPDYTLHLAKKRGSLIAILWYEPPVSTYDFCTLLPSVHVGKDSPFIRRKISADYYEHLLKKHDLTIKHQQDDGPKASLHILG